MPPPTSSLKPAGGKTNGNAAHAAPAPAADAEKRTGKPDQAKYNAEQDELNKEIAGVKSKLDAIRSRISLAQAPSSGDRRSVLKGEMDALRSEQGKYKVDRGKIFDEMKRLQDGVQRKIKEVQTQRGKLGFKSVQEVDDRIRSLDKQVESGTMKLIDEKKALQEISQLKRSRKALESSTSADDSIAAEKARIDELRKQLDDPEAKKVGDRFDELKKEMDSLREEGNKAYEERGKLFDERNALQAKMDELYGKKRESAQLYKDENDKHYAKMQADRSARQERFKAEKAQEDASRREEEVVRLREEAKVPAYAAEIEDCGVLIGWFKGRYGGTGEVPTTNAGGKDTEKTVLEGVKKLEIRKVDSDFKGMAIKKKGDDEDLGFFGGGGKKKGKSGVKKGSASVSGTATPSSEAAAAPAAVNLPMSLLSAILSLGIPPPSGKDDVPRTIEDLETKKAWFEANSATKTKAEIERVEKVVAKLLKKNAILSEGDDATEDAEEVVPEVGGKKEPTHSKIFLPSLVDNWLNPASISAVAVAGAADGPDIVEQDGLQLPTDAEPTEEVKHVDSALEEIKASE
ncbi:hypothetical protein P7C73_g6042, partial [Tremellales sp. Uapishka_1]